MKFRKATKKDLVKVVELLADDEQGKTREICREPLPIEYINAFENIDNDPTQELIVVENDDLEIIGSMQLSYLQYLTYRGGLRAQIEAVRVRSDKRGNGIGKMMFEWAINRAKERNAHLIQLTTDKERSAALKFYKTLGFKDSHEGMKMYLK
nr:GNAT family N-acetyltransferase [uncultured Draconibacterium sp.]